MPIEKQITRRLSATKKAIGDALIENERLLLAVKKQTIGDLPRPRDKIPGRRLASIEKAKHDPPFP